MKISIISLGIAIALFAIGTVLTSCGGRSASESESTEQHNMEGHEHGEMVSATFACPMHPEITGHEGDKCSKCGMKLIASNNDDHDMSKMDMSAKAKCPMHPEEMGEEGDKCSKCGMALVLNESDEHTHED